MADTTSKAVINVDANTASAVTEVLKLAKAMKSLSDAADETKKKNSFSQFVDQATVGLGKFNLAVGGVKATFDLLNGALQMAGERAREATMEKLLPSGTVDKFRDATDKLIGRQDVLRLSVKGMTGDFALNSAQMEKVLKTSVALQERGFGPAAQVAEKLIEALGEKGVDKLDDFGIALEKTGDKLADNNKAYAEFDKLITGTDVSEETKRIAQLSAVLEEFGRAVKSVVSVAVQGFVSIGETIGETAAEWALQQVGLTGQEFHGMRDMTPEERAARIARGEAEKAAREARLAPMRQANAEALKNWVSSYYTSDKDKKALGGGYDSQALEYLEEDVRKKRKPGKWVDPREYGVKGGVIIPGEEGLGYGALPGGLAPTASFGSAGYGGVGSGMLNQAGNWNRLAGEGAGANGGFGTQAKPAEQAAAFMAQLTDRATMAGGAFGVFTDSFGAAVSAAVDGSESMGKAFAKASAAGLKALAVEYAVRAIGEGAWALSSLAFNDYKGAAAHGLSAAKFAAAAAAAGIGSAALGALAGGGGGGAGAAGGGFANAGTGGGGGGRGEAQTIVVNLGDGFYGDSDKVAEAVARGVRQGNRRGARDTYSTKFSG